MSAERMGEKMSDFVYLTLYASAKGKKICEAKNTVSPLSSLIGRVMKLRCCFGVR